MYPNQFTNLTFDEERALYGCRDTQVLSCRFDGPADGESAFKECANILAKDCFFNLRYPFWHDENAILEGCQLTEQCRAALWYTHGASLRGCRLHGIKALRECADVTIENCDVISAEFGWFCRNVRMTDTQVKGEYFMLRGEDLNFSNVTLDGKYSFQYITDSTFDGCVLSTKDAFWHAKNVLVRNSVIRGEYLAWYSENVTFENCRIIGTQPLCYCKGLKLIHCRMEDTDLSFERSQVEATVDCPILSIKNPASGYIQAPAIGQIILDEYAGDCRIQTDN